LKKTFALIGVATLLLGALTGCSTKSTIIAGSKVVIGEVGSLESFNTDMAVGGTVRSDLEKLTTTSFYEQNELGVLVANEKLGTAKITSKAPFTVVYKLNGTAKWSDGTVIDASDLLLSWLAANDPTQAGFQSQRTATGLALATKTPVALPDNTGITVIYDQAVADWQTALRIAVPAHSLVQAAFEDQGLSVEAAKAKFVDMADSLKATQLKTLAKAYTAAFSANNGLSKENQQTSGAYSFKSFDGNLLTLAANPNFTAGKPTQVEEIDLKFFQDPASLLDAMSKAEVDVAAPQESSSLGLSDLVSSLTALKDSGVNFASSPSANVEQIVLNHDSKSFFNAKNFGGKDVKAQKLQDAFLKLVPRSKILAAIASQVGIQESNSFAFAGTSSFYTPVVQSNGSTAFRIQEAELAREEVLSTKPVGGRYSVRVLFDSDNPRAQIEFGLLDELASSVGFKLQNFGVSDISKDLTKGNFDVLISAAPLLAEGITADGNLLSSNLTGFNDSNVSNLLAKLASQSTEFGRAKVLQKIDNLLFKGHYGVPLYQVPSIVAYSSRLSGFAVSPFGANAVWGFNNWSVAPSSAK